ncbi:MAG: NADH:flavin oxidoreductase [SAR324 cluster bacterium]|nr:NADH:flavin oxidoreductase [SAR324 cluster bacterium]MCZ6531974.1 NADH:flavin oxidoreductase [SAR324 cluster bacterium]MCZ6556141.1 NADH:flavin oxidoreductase [SAR324 cluster bacterium]MCZ6628436.1 NADH:flavin oxidoreductase [SAR324 cluster bacterium]MCZ6646152.1 NADH:flavin oxidoreductase [SAR324 cluster bacterium]
MFEPVNLNHLQLRNRIAFSPFQENQANKDGSISGGMHEYYLDIAREGAGVLILESAYVVRQGRAHVNQMGISAEFHTENLARLIDDAHKEGAAICVRLAHAGAKTSEAICGEQPVGPAILNFGKEFDTSREFDDGDVEEIVLFFVHAAERAEEAGADIIEINGGQQYLLDQCLSTRFNNRYDAYGGAIEARMHLATEIIKAIKSRISPKIPISFLFTIHDKLEDGFGEDDLKRLVKSLVSAKVDLLHPVTVHVLNKFFDAEETLVELVGRATKVPIIAEGNIKSPQILKEAMSLKKAQIYTLDKALFSRPNWYSFLQRKIVPQ